MYTQLTCYFGRSVFTTKQCVTINPTSFNRAVKCNDTLINIVEILRLSIKFHTFFQLLVPKSSLYKHSNFPNNCQILVTVLVGHDQSRLTVSGLGMHLSSAIIFITPLKGRMCLMNLETFFNGILLFIFENFILMKCLKNAFLNYVKTESIGRIYFN